MFTHSDVADDSSKETPREQRDHELSVLLPHENVNYENMMNERFSLVSSPGADEMAKFGFSDIRMLSLRKKLVRAFKAAADGDLESLHSFLSEASNNPDFLDERGFSALHYAARYNQAKAASLLLDFGAKVDVRGEDGSTPLHLAVR